MSVTRKPAGQSVIPDIAPSVPAAMKALHVMERQLGSAQTYAQFRRIKAEAEVLKKLLGHVDEVRQQAERVVISACARIGEEIGKLPKGNARRRITPGGNSSTKSEVYPSGTGRSRLQKLAAMGDKTRRVIIEDLHRNGKNATIKAVLGESKELEIREARRVFESRRDRGCNVATLEAMIARGQRFPVIYADPPWEFKVYSGKGKQRSAERHYDTMTLDDIKALPVAKLAADDCALFIWGICPECPGLLEVIKAWGFDYKTFAFIWIKTAPNAEHVTLDGDGLHWGMGYHTRSNAEVCGLATRGAPQRDAKDVHQIVLAPVGEHSEKPEEVRRRIERLVIGPYLELFARRPVAVAGWTTWGQEIEAEEAAQ
jgi:N6-adenosine-specific RNA methylase IME4